MTAPPHRESGDTIARLLVDQVVINAQVVDDHHGEELDQQDIISSLVQLADNGCSKIGLAAFEIMLGDQYPGTANN